MFRYLISQRAIRVGFVLLAVALLAGAATRDASAKPKSCANQVIADWYDDGRVGKIYPLHCYPEAIKLLGTDARDYTNAEEEIGRAYAYAKLGKPDPGPDGTPPTDTTKTDTTKTDTSSTDTSGPSAVPVPLLVLGGLAVLLLAAGSAGYLRRRMNADGDGDDSGDDSGTPPTSA